MKLNLKFKAKDVQSLAEHSRAHLEENQAGCSCPDHVKPPFLRLVKDEGVYLMSGAPNPVEEGKGRQVVSYAEGHTPDDGWLGGDDFVEYLPADMFKVLDGKDLEGGYVLIGLTETEISVEVGLLE